MNQPEPTVIDRTTVEAPHYDPTEADRATNVGHAGCQHVFQPTRVTNFVINFRQSKWIKQNVSTWPPLWEDVIALSISFFHPDPIRYQPMPDQYVGKVSAWDDTNVIIKVTRIDAAANPGRPIGINVGLSFRQ